MKRCIHIMFIQLLGIILVIFWEGLNYEGVEINFSQEEMQIWDEHRNAREGSYIDISYPESKGGVVTPAVSLEKGIYYIEFSYESNGIVKAGLIYDILHKTQEVVEENEFIVNTEKNVSAYRVEINDTSAIRFKLRLTGDAGAGDYINLKGVRIVQSKLTYVKRIVCIAFLVALCDLLVLLYNYLKKCQPEKKIIIMILGFTSFFIGIPLYQNGLTNGIDLNFHLWRIEGIYEGLISGQLPVRIQPGWLEGYGYASSIFYGDILLYFPAILRMIGFTLQDAYKIFLVVLNVMTVFSSFLSFRKISQNDMAALVGAVIYSGSIERLYRMYGASRVGMFSAMTFYPIVLLGLYQLFAGDSKKKEYKNTWKYLVIGYSGLLMTHMISCLIWGLFTILLCVICVKKLIRKKTVFEIVKSLVAGILVNLWFLVPFFHYFLIGRVRIFSGIVPKGEVDYYVELAGFQKGARSISGLFLEVGDSKQGLGYVLTFVLILYILSIPWQKKDLLTKTSRVVFGFALLGMLLCTELFPAIQIAKFNKVFLKLFQIIQYQDRFLAITAVLIACLAVLLFSMELLRKEVLYLLVAGLMFFSLYQNMEYFSKLSADIIYLDKVDLESKIGKSEYAYGVGNGEYIPEGADVTLFRDEIIFDASAVNLETIERNYLRYQITGSNISEEEQTILLPILYYDGYQSWDLNTKEVIKTDAGDNVRVAVTLPANYRGTFEVKFISPWFWRAAEVVSLLSVICMLMYTAKKKYKGRGDNESNLHVSQVSYQSDHYHERMG